MHSLYNKEIVYDILFRAVKETLLEAAENPFNLGARIGFIAILHTWGQNLMVHPHIHCVVPGGGLSMDGKRWIVCKRGFLVSVKVLSKLFRGKFLAFLKQAFQDHRLHCCGEHKELETPGEFQRLLDDAYTKQWVVYAKKPFSGPQQVLRYLGKYTHRVAISNHRIVKIGADIVSFTWKEYHNSGTMKTMSLSTAEFMRRFLLHVIPKRFVRIRFYGLLSNRNKRESLSRCRELLDEIPTEGENEGQNHETAQEIIPENECLLCPECQKGHMIIVMVIEPEPLAHNVVILDSS